MHSAITAGEAQRCVHTTPAGAKWVSGTHGVITHRVGSDPPALPTTHNTLPPECFDEVADPNPQQPDWDRIDFARLLIIESDFNLGRLVYRNIEVLVPPVGLGIMRSGALSTINLDEYEGVNSRLRSRT